MESAPGRDAVNSPGRPRLHRGVAVVAAGATVAALLGSALTLALGGLDLAPACGSDGQVLRLRGGGTSCMHTDEAPPGVDVTDPVSTAELRARPGAGPAASQAAEDLGVPTAVASAATTPDVTCDGDGTSGYRTQVMYVVEAGATNRFASLLGSFRVWAAGVDDVVNRSAALTGGVRHIRYVTTAGAGGTCVADVLNVTVPAGSMTSFDATIDAVRAQGYTDATRKYLMYTDATRLCGVATLYTNDRADQANPNNGSYAQYARVDSGCWGLGNGSGEHSVEAHELVHTLGAVLRSAPHSTVNGHCWDESDTMCYADGDAHAMVNVCPADREYLLDCNSDDYFSTFPDPGSYLDSHWDAASSRFLIGGGDGSGSGSTGAPTVLGARLAVNNPAVPGLATQATVTPVLPTGRSLASVAWTAARKDCVLGTPDQVQTTVTCNAGSATATTVTATVTDSTGATKTVTSPLTFTTGGTPRPVSLVLKVAGQSSDQVASASMCTGVASPVSAVLADTQTGLAIRGLTAAFTKTVGSKTSSAGSATSDGSGIATVSQSAKAATTYAAGTSATATYAGASAVSLPATVERCTPTLTGSASAQSLWSGDSTTVSGTLTRTAGGVDGVPLAGTAVTVSLTSTVTSASGRVTTRTTRLAAPRTAADGSFSVAVTPAASGELVVGVAGSSGLTATTRDLGAVTVTPSTTTLDATVDRSDVGYGSTVTVTGSLERAAAGTTGVAGATVTVKVTAPGARTATTLASGRTSTDGSFEVPAPLKASGALSVVYGGTALLPKASHDLGDVTAGIWDTSLTATPSASSVAASSPVTLTGTLTRSYGGVSEGVKGVPVKVVARAAGATRDTTTSASTAAAGAFKVVVRPKVTTTYTVRVVGVRNYADASATSFTVTVP